MSDFREDPNKRCKDHPIQWKWILFITKFEHWYHNTWLGKKWYGEFYDFAPYDHNPMKIDIPWQTRYYIWKMRRNEFNPLWFTLYGGEYTLLFATKEEAHEAYEKFENDKFQAFYYGMDDDKMNFDDKFLDNCVKL